MIVCALQKFGLPFFSVVKNGFIAVDIGNVSLDQAEMFMKYAAFIAMFNGVTRRAGFTQDWFDSVYPEGYSKEQWCYPTPTIITNFIHCNDPRTHYNSGCEHDALMKEANDLLFESNRDGGSSPITDCLYFHFARNRVTGNISNLSQHALEEEIHRIDPRVVTFDKPSVSVAIDGISCKMSRCFSQECKNNRAYADQFGILINKWKATDEFIGCHFSQWESSAKHAPSGSTG